MMCTINLVKVLPGPSEGEGTRRLHTHIRLSAALYVYGIDRLLFSSHWALLVSPGGEANEAHGLVLRNSIRRRILSFSAGRRHRSAFVVMGKTERATWHLPLKRIVPTRPSARGSGVTPKNTLVNTPSSDNQAPSDANKNLAPPIERPPPAAHRPLHIAPKSSAMQPGSRLYCPPHSSVSCRSPRPRPPPDMSTPPPPSRRSPTTSSAPRTRLAKHRIAGFRISQSQSVLSQTSEHVTNVQRSARK